MPDLLLVGGGGHALVVIDAARALGIGIAGVLDDRDRPTACVGTDAVRWLGPIRGDQGSADGGAAGLVRSVRGGAWIIALGDCGARERVMLQLAGVAGVADAGEAITLVHPAAWISPSAALGPGVFVGARAVVQARARVGPHAIVNTAAVIEHECEVGAGAHVAPGSVLAGGVRVGEHALVGMGAVVLPGVEVGPRAVVGAGAVVRRAVGAGERVAGNPARPIDAG